MLPMPMVGAVRAGDPVFADEQIETVFPLPAELVGSDTNCFMLVVRGDSMINAGIQEGDYLIVAEQETARNGDIVVALVGNDDATVKRFSAKLIIFVYNRKMMIMNRLFREM